MSIEEDKSANGEKGREPSPLKAKKKDVKKNKEEITRTLEEYIDVLNKYDDRMEHHVKLISNILTRRNDEALSEDTMAMSEGDTRTRRVGPKIISNIQVVPPRGQTDSASEIASISSMADGNQWRTAGKKRSNRAKRILEEPTVLRTAGEPRDDGRNNTKVTKGRS